MLLLLPPSETKRDGGDDARSLDLADLGFPALTRPRRTALAALRRLARNRTTMAAALSLGPSQAHEIERNRAIASAPVMPAILRYTGVLYDALDAATLRTEVGSVEVDNFEANNIEANSFATESLVVHSALFGLLRAHDQIPAYRLSHDSKLPDVKVKSLWADPISRELDAVPGVVVDMRSEAYVAMGPLPAGENRAFLRVVTEGPGGIRRALNHFNKKGKGEFARAIVAAGIRHPDLDSLIEWARDAGIRLERGAPGQLELIVDEVVPKQSR